MFKFLFALFEELACQDPSGGVMQGLEPYPNVISPESLDTLPFSVLFLALISARHATIALKILN